MKTVLVLVKCSLYTTVNLLFTATVALFFWGEGYAQGLDPQPS